MSEYEAPLIPNLLIRNFEKGEQEECIAAVACENIGALRLNSSVPNYVAALDSCLQIRFVLEDLVGLKEHTDGPWCAMTIVHLEIILLTELLWEVT